MPKENRFAGLGEVMEGDDDHPDSDEEAVVDDEREVTDPSDGDGPEDEPEGGASGSETDGTDDSSEEDENGEEEEDVGESESESDGESHGDGDDEGDGAGEAPDEADETADEPDAESEGGPAFEFEATTAKSIYVRPETLDQLDDAEFEVESLLRREHDVRDLTGREFHDALVTVASEYADEIVDQILSQRED